jgi:PBP1b-binding outer membrane lipoprotein LpoB
MTVKRIITGVSLASMLTLTGCSQVPAGYRGVNSQFIWE